MTLKPVLQSCISLKQPTGFPGITSLIIAACCSKLSCKSRCDRCEIGILNTGALRFAATTWTPQGKCNSSKDLITILFHTRMVYLGTHYTYCLSWMTEITCFAYTVYSVPELNMLLWGLSEICCLFAGERRDFCAPADRR